MKLSRFAIALLCASAAPAWALPPTIQPVPPSVGTTAGTVAAGDDSRITGSLPKTGGTLTGVITGGSLSGTDVTGAAVYPAGASFARTVGAIAGDQDDPKSYGAIGDGSSHTVSATLGISTAAGLIAYSSNGQTPYSFVNTEPFGVRFNLHVAAAVASGATTLPFAGSATIGTQIKSQSAIASTNTTVSVADLAVTADGTAVAAGNTLTASCLASNATVTSVSGASGAYTVTFSPAATGACASGTLLKFGVAPAAGVYALPITFTSGVRQGDLITGSSCVAAGTQVDLVNPSKSEIRLSAPTTAICAVGTHLTFIPSWLSNVTAGMYVRGLAGTFASTATVSAVNTSTGVVTLSAATTAAITPTTAVLGVATPTMESTQVTFWRPYTDAEIANLQMDRLGWQAAINAISPTMGGGVLAPPGQYQIDAPLIGPISATYLSGNRPQASIGGANSVNPSSVTLIATKDFGPNTAVFSCGDPAGSLQNGFGIYTGVGYYCSGNMHDLYVTGPTPTFTPGERPKWGGVPVAMDGIKQGPRLMMERVTSSGFNAAIRFAGDHTYWSYVTGVASFIGIYFDDAQIGLYGDEFMSNIYFMGNNWAGVMISPRTFLNVQMSKGYTGFNPYAFYCEAGVGAESCIGGSTFTNLNSESVDCGIIKDGSLADGTLPALGAGGITSTIFENGFFGISVNGSNVRTGSFQLAGGCQYNASFDLFGVNGLKLKNTSNPNFSPVAGQTALIRVSLSDGHYGTNNGGGVIEGDFLWDMIQAFSALNVSMVSGPGTLGQDGLFWSGGWQNWRLSGPGWRGVPMPVAYNSAASYSLGEVMEYTLGAGTNNLVAVQPAGTTANAPVAGTVCAPGASNPFANSFIPIICTGGIAIPVKTTVTQGTAQMVKVGTTTPGTAVAATDMTSTGNGSGPIGIIVRPSSGTLSYMKALFLGAE